MSDQPAGGQPPGARPAGAQPTVDLSQLRLVRARLDDLITTGQQTFPQVQKVPRPDKKAYELITLVAAALTPVVAPPDEHGRRRVLANQGTVALLEALLPHETRQTIRVRCWEWQAVGGDLPSIDAPHAVLDLMVEPPRIPPERARRAQLRKRHNLVLCRREPDALGGVAPSASRRPK